MVPSGSAHKVFLLFSWSSSYPGHHPMGVMASGTRGPPLVAGDAASRVLQLNGETVGWFPEGF